MHKKNIVAVFVFFIISIFIFSFNQVLASEEEVEISLSKENITLYPPFEITDTMLYKDGGTIAVMIEDKQGKVLPVCYDRRIKVPRSERYLYVGATHPTNTGAKKIFHGSQTEKAILEILKTANINQSKPNIRKDLVKSIIKLIENNK